GSGYPIRYDGAQNTVSRGAAGDRAAQEGPMTRRSRAREVALQMLFQRDLNPGVDRAALEQFARDRLREPGLIAFCLSLYDGVVTNLAAIDERLTAAAENWRLPRMAAVDRNVLRLAAFELLFRPDTPSPAAL